MKKIIAFLSVFIAIVFVCRHKPVTTHKGATLKFETSTAASKTLRRQIASKPSMVAGRELQQPQAFGSERSRGSIPEGLQASILKQSKGMVVERSFGSTSLSRNQAERSLQKKPQSAYDSNDQPLLEQALLRAQTEASHIAYVGGVAALMAFEPRFIQAFRTANGQVDYRAQRVDSVQPLQTPQGTVSMAVQRIPYPLPPGFESNYELLNRAIMKATDDGAMVINLATQGLERTRLQTSIQYARTRGAVVITVSKN